MVSAKNVNWNLLYTFVVVAEAQSISTAANILGRGQPAVSAALKTLEDQVGIRLVERGPRLFRLTEAGRVLHREASEICGAVDRVLALLQDSDATLAGTVRLTIASFMTSGLLNEALTRFHANNPRSSVSSTVMNTPEILEALSNKLIHFGIAPISSRDPRFDYFHIFKEYCGFYCGPDHEFYGRKGLKVSDLKGQGMVTYQSAMVSDALRSITLLQKELEFRYPPVGISNNLEEVRRMVLSGLGIGAFPVQIAHRDVRDGLLWRLPPYEDVMPIDVYLITNDKVRPSRTEREFLSTLRDVVTETPIEARTYTGAMFS
ncbi:MAG: LysR family transcriptional regulator [Alphaproteobacteria bacterium]|nr:LysR family transcriptional regulator [Alphaproteobacteria bacterium]